MSLLGKIESAKFLLQFQKDALTKMIEEDEEGDDSEAPKLAYMTFLDEVFRKLLGGGIEEILSAEEQVILRFVCNDFIRSRNDKDLRT